MGPGVACTAPSFDHRKLRNFDMRPPELTGLIRQDRQCDDRSNLAWDFRFGAISHFLAFDFDFPFPHTLRFPFSPEMFLHFSAKFTNVQ